MPGFGMYMLAGLIVVTGLSVLEMYDPKLALAWAGMVLLALYLRYPQVGDELMKVAAIMSGRRV